MNSTDIVNVRFIGSKRAPLRGIVLERHDYHSPDTAAIPVMRSAAVVAVKFPDGWRLVSFTQSPSLDWASDYNGPESQALYILKDNA